MSGLPVEVELTLRLVLAALVGDRLEAIRSSIATVRPEVSHESGRPARRQRIYQVS